MMDFHNLIDICNWYRFRNEKEDFNYHKIFLKVVELGNWLNGHNYIGYDVKVGNPENEISTVLSSSLVGWGNLYQITLDEKYLDNVEYCVKRILSIQEKNGAWLFHYQFRNNPPGHPYACENFMTLSSLFYYHEKIKQNDLVVDAIKRSLNFLENEIGFQKGLFWYSSTDKINVPNISSMAANAYTHAFNIFRDSKYKDLANEFAQYCIENQNCNGAYPYFADEELVSIPYHALEIWELQEANQLLDRGDVTESLIRGIDYLRNHFSKYNYHSTNTNYKQCNQQWLFKTPIWGAKALLSMGDFDQSVKHYWSALHLFDVPKQPNYFYILKRICVGHKYLSIPVIHSQFVRYNASGFEIGTRILLYAKEKKSIVW